MVAQSLSKFTPRISARAHRAQRYADLILDCSLPLRFLCRSRNLGGVMFVPLVVEVVQGFAECLELPDVAMICRYQGFWRHSLQ